MIDRRVAIVTINDDTNYGNRLQNFALQEVVRSLGWEPETLRNRPPAWDPALRGPRIRHELRHDLAGLMHRTVDRARHRLGRSSSMRTCKSCAITVIPRNIVTAIAPMIASVAAAFRD